jgi:hypothetical protein
MQYWVHSQNIVAIRVIKMAFINDIVELRELLRKHRFILTLFEHILLFIPVPRGVNLSKILNDESFFTNT